jgi:hypothetical protein
MTPAYLRHPSTIGTCSGEIARLMESDKAEYVALATALLAKAKATSMRKTRQVVMLADDN